MRRIDWLGPLRTAIRSLVEDAYENGWREGFRRGVHESGASILLQTYPPVEAMRAMRDGREAYAAAVIEGPQVPAALTTVVPLPALAEQAALSLMSAREVRERYPDVAERWDSDCPGWETRHDRKAPS